MAVVVDELRLIYLLAPGTGSTAVADFLIENYNSKHIPEHDVKDSSGNIIVRGKQSNFSELKQANLLRSDQLQYLKATGVRNPYDYFYAEWYRYRTRWIKLISDKSSWVFNSEKKLQDIVDSVTMNFSEWLVNKLQDIYQSRSQIMLFSEYVKDADMYIRLEHLDADLTEVLSTCIKEGSTQINVNVPQINVTDRDREYWRHYSKEAREMVEFIFQPYMNKFSYWF